MTATDERRQAVQAVRITADHLAECERRLRVAQTQYDAAVEAAGKARAVFEASGGSL